jgi:hypothetical protein
MSFPTGQGESRGLWEDNAKARFRRVENLQISILTEVEQPIPFSIAQKSKNSDAGPVC